MSMCLLFHPSLSGHPFCLHLLALLECGLTIGHTCSMKATDNRHVVTVMVHDTSDQLSQLCQLQHTMYVNVLHRRKSTLNTPKWGSLTLAQ